MPSLCQLLTPTAKRQRHPRVRRIQEVGARVRQQPSRPGFDSSTSRAAAPRRPARPAAPRRRPPSARHESQQRVAGQTTRRLAERPERGRRLHVDRDPTSAAAGGRRPAVATADPAGPAGAGARHRAAQLSPSSQVQTTYGTSSTGSSASCNRQLTRSACRALITTTAQLHALGTETFPTGGRVSATVCCTVAQGGRHRRRHVLRPSHTTFRAATRRQLSASQSVAPAVAPAPTASTHAIDQA